MIEALDKAAEAPRESESSSNRTGRVDLTPLSLLCLVVGTSREWCLCISVSLRPRSSIRFSGLRFEAPGSSDIRLRFCGLGCNKAVSPDEEGSLPLLVTPGNSDFLLPSFVMHCQGLRFWFLHDSCGFPCTRIGGHTSSSLCLEVSFCGTGWEFWVPSTGTALCHCYPSILHCIGCK